MAISPLRNILDFNTMKKTIFAQLLSMAAIAALAVSMNACGKDDENGIPAAEENLVPMVDGNQVLDATLPADVVSSIDTSEVKIYVDEDNHRVAVGEALSITENNISIKFPTTGLDQYLLSMTEFMRSWAGNSASKYKAEPADAKITTGDIGVANSSSDYPRILSRRYDDNPENPIVTIEEEFWYATKDCSISGSEQDEEDTIIVSLKLKTGWNIVYKIYDGNTITTTTTMHKDTDKLKWQLN
jgi:hypothetical protein